MVQNPLVLDALMALLILLATYVFLRGLYPFLGTKLQKLGEKRKVAAIEIMGKLIHGTNFSFLLGLGLLASLPVAPIPASYMPTVKIVIIFLVLLQIGLWGNALTSLILRRISEERGEDPSSLSAFSLIGFVARLVIWATVALLMLDNLGIDVTALIAGLGIGGIAIALAVQNILGDLLASLSIVLDKPFEVGDFIVIDELSGTVERIGVKTTRIRSLSGEQLVFPNSDLLSSCIRNFKRMYERRVALNIGVTYQTSQAKLEKIPEMITQIVNSQDQIRFDRCHLNSLGDSAICFELVYYVLISDYTAHMQIQQNILLAIIKKFESEQIEMAYPTQTIFVEKVG